MIFFGFFYHLTVTLQKKFLKNNVIMKNFIITFLLLIVGFELSAQRKIEMQHSGQNSGHSGLPIWPADQPDVYYDATDQVIIIDGPGSEASYYDVDIVSMSTLDVMLSTQVNGTYDTIDVSSLPDDNYKIVITSSNFNEYEGYFTKVPGKNRWKWIYDDEQQ